MPRRLLVSWIGNNDLRPMALDQSEAKRSEMLAGIKGECHKGELGPIRTLVESVAFEKIVLLTNFRSDWSRRYLKWLGKKADVVEANIKPPTDYTSIFKTVDAVLAGLRGAGATDSHELCFHLSPGSPAMTAVWLLLGKSKYPATFYQSYNGKAWVTEVPFDLTVDLLPDLFANADKHRAQRWLNSKNGIYRL